jgi:acyl-CoA synthetase (AMP-forming)/AMP-acid ligase II
MALLLTRHDAHPFMGMDVPWLLEQRAQTRRDHPFVVCVPFDGAVRSLSCGEFHARVTRIKEACNAQRADFKRPHEMRIVEDFPRSTLEKIAKAELRRMLQDEPPANPS